MIESILKFPWHFCQFRNEIHRYNARNTVDRDTAIVHKTRTKFNDRFLLKYAEGQYLRCAVGVTTPPINIKSFPVMVFVWAFVEHGLTRYVKYGGIASAYLSARQTVSITGRDDPCSDIYLYGRNETCECEKLIKFVSRTLKAQSYCTDCRKQIERDPCGRHQGVGGRRAEREESKTAAAPSRGPSVPLFQSARRRHYRPAANLARSDRAN